MGQKANAGQVYFNYPIPKAVHRQVKQLSLDTNMKVKDIVTNALVMYVSSFYGEEDENKEVGDDL